MSRDLSMSFTKSLVVYHGRIESNNTITENIDINKDSSELSYKTTQEKAIWVGKAANSNYNIVNITSQCASNTHPNTTFP